MRRATISIIGILLSISVRALAVCPVTIVNGVGEPDGNVLTFRNPGKLLIRQLEFSCKSQPTQRASNACREANALFYPGMQYTVRYPYPDGKANTVTLAVKSVTTSDGFTWEPTRKQPCRTLRIVPRQEIEPLRSE
jgi:hypothetical protein